jgi:hypothetical protein
MGQLRHLYVLLVEGKVSPQARAAKYLLSPAIEALEVADRAADAQPGGLEAAERIARYFDYAALNEPSRDWPASLIAATIRRWAASGELLWPVCLGLHFDDPAAADPSDADKP